MGGFRNSTTDRKTYFLGINGNGVIYESSKEPKEGFVEHINPVTNQPAGFRKEYYSGLVGYLNYIGTKVIPNKQGVNVSYFVMTFRDWDSNDDFCFMFPMTNQKGGMHRYVKSFVKYYPNIDFSKELVFNAFKRKSNEEFAPSNLIFAYPGADGGKDMMVPVFYKDGQNGWPAGVKKMGFGGKEIMDYSVQDGFAYENLMKFIEDFNKRIPEIRQSIMANRGMVSGVNNGPKVQPQPAAPVQYSQPGGYQPQPSQQPQPAQPAQQPQPGGFYQAQGQPAAPQSTVGYSPQGQPVQSFHGNSQQPPEYPEITDEGDLPF